MTRALTEKQRHELAKMKRRKKTEATMLETMLASAQIVAARCGSPGAKVAAKLIPEVIDECRAMAAKIEELLRKDAAANDDWRGLALSLTTTAAKMQGVREAWTVLIFTNRMENENDLRTPDTAANT